MKKLFSFILMIIMMLPVSEAFAADNLPLPTVNYVDLNKYMGKWYEIASFPHWYQKNCVGTTAEYTLKEDGDVAIINSCHLKTFEGKLKTVKGSAYVVDKKTNAKLKVTFFWPFYGDYWILDLGPKYEYAIVGTPDRKSLWILSRKPTMSNELLAKLKKKAESLGFDMNELLQTWQQEEK